MSATHEGNRLDARGPEIGGDANPGQVCKVGQVPKNGKMVGRCRGQQGSATYVSGSWKKLKAKMRVVMNPINPYTANSKRIAPRVAEENTGEVTLRKSRSNGVETPKDW